MSWGESDNVGAWRVFYNIIQPQEPLGFVMRLICLEKLEPVFSFKSFQNKAQQKHHKYYMYNMYPIIWL